MPPRNDLTTLGEVRLPPSCGFHGSAPVAVPAAYTLTYSTTRRTHPTLTSTAVATTAATSTAPFGYAQAQADDIVAQLNNLRTDLTNLKQLLNQVISDMQRNGLLA